MGKLRVIVLLEWVQRQSTKMKVFLGGAAALLALATLWLLVHNHNYNHFLIASKAVHTAGVLVLIYKLSRQKSCSGLSLKSQELTALFLAIRLYCSMVAKSDLHAILDFATLASTIWVIYMMRFKLKSTYSEDLDNMPRYVVVVPCLILAYAIHPSGNKQSLRIHPVLWAFFGYLEAISILPQLHVMQNAKMVEPFTAHYVFALGVARFLGCATWILKIVELRGKFFHHMGPAVTWVPMALFTEAVQTFILADFCYYYVKSAIYGELLVRFPSNKI